MTAKVQVFEKGEQVKCEMFTSPKYIRHNNQNIHRFTEH